MKNKKSWCVNFYNARGKANGIEVEANSIEDVINYLFCNREHLDICKVYEVVELA